MFLCMFSFLCCSNNKKLFSLKFHTCTCYYRLQDGRRILILILANNIFTMSSNSLNISHRLPLPPPPCPLALHRSWMVLIRGHGKAIQHPQPEHPVHSPVRRPLFSHNLKTSPNIHINCIDCGQEKSFTQLERQKLSVSHWYNLLTKLSNFEKLTPTLNDNMLPFHNTWFPFLQFIQS